MSAVKTTDITVPPYDPDQPCILDLPDGGRVFLLDLISREKLFETKLSEGLTAEIVRRMDAGYKTMFLDATDQTNVKFLKESVAELLASGGL